MNIMIRSSAFIAAILMVGCATSPREKPVHQQGWIGGSYKCAKSRSTVTDKLFGADNTIFCFPSGLEHTQSAGIVAAEIGTNTPAFKAGLRAGDLILEVAHQPVTNLPAFWR